MRSGRPWSRRAVLKSAIAAGVLGPGDIWPKLSLAVDVPLTPACREGHEELATLPSAAGPYFKPNSPERSDFVDTLADGHPISLEGRILSRSCRPVAHALLDLWHADQNGLYDENGFRYRGHMFSDAQGRYRFHSIEPAVYPGRTRHFHIKVQAREGPVLTTQLFFPGEPRNQVDALFRPQLLMIVSDTPALMSARFDFVIDA
jgi:protocatechuate 3,4-dioxygenase beta subunit